MSKAHKHPDVTFCQKWLKHRDGMTYAEIAAKVGVSERWLTYLANDEIANPTLGRIASLKHFIGARQRKAA